MRFNKLLKLVLGFDREVVVTGWEVEEDDDGRRRPNVLVMVRPRVGWKGRCGRCRMVAPGYDQGGRADATEPGVRWLRRWRHVDLGFATCDLAGDAPRVCCPEHGVIVAVVPWARHDSAFTRAFEDLVVWEALASNKTSAALSARCRGGRWTGCACGSRPRRSTGSTCSPAWSRSRSTR